MEDLEIIRIRLESYFSDTYRTIWVQTAGNPGQKSVLITLFPIDGSQYNMVALRRLPAITYDNILAGILKDPKVMSYHGSDSTTRKP